MTKATKNTRKSNKSEQALQFNLQTEVLPTASSDDAILADMLGELELGDEILEPVGEPLNAGAAVEPAAEAALAVGDTLLDDLDLAGLEGLEADVAGIEAALSEQSKVEANQKVYEEQDGEAEVERLFASPADRPAEEGAPAKPEKKAREPKAPKPPKDPRVTYVNGRPADVLKAKLGDKAGEILLLEASDLELEGDALKAKQDELLELMNARPHSTSTGGSTQKKVAEKIVMLFAWIKNGGALNEVMRRTFTVLARDGYVTSGDKGNLHAELLAKPYSVGTCRAQAGQMMSMLPMLKIATKGEKGRLEANPDSLIFMKVKADLGL